MTTKPGCVDRIRSCFPALQREVNGLPVAYFDGPGGTQVPASVAGAVREHLLAHNANGGWRFPTSREAGAVATGAREAVADLVGSRGASVAFGPSMTSLAWRFARAAAARLEAGDVVVTTRLDHRANVDPWKSAAKERGARCTSIPFTAGSGLDLDRYDRILAGGRVRIVAVTAASNVLGTVVDVGRVAERARSAGALCFVDGVHAAPHVRLRVEQWGCDALAASPYKFYGPHAGVLWMSEDLMNGLDTDRIEPAPAEGPEAWESGTPSYEAMAGTTAAVDWIAGLAPEGRARDGNPARDRPRRLDPPARRAARRGRLDGAFEALHARALELTERLWGGLVSIDGVTVYGPEPGPARTPTVAFSIRGVDAPDGAARLAERLAVFVSHGHFYAPDVLEDLGVEEPGGLLRAGCACYTTIGEIDRLVSGVAELVSR